MNPIRVKPAKLAPEKYTQDTKRKLSHRTNGLLNEEPWTCPLDGRSFPLRKNYLKHIQKCHPRKKEELS